MRPYFVTLVALICNIYLGTCSEITMANEGDKVVLQCRFHIPSYKRELISSLWLYPDENDTERITINQTFRGDSFLTYIEIKNATKSKDEGHYDCILNYSTGFLAERSYDLELKERPQNTKADDKIDGRQTSLNKTPNDFISNFYHNDAPNNTPENIQMKEVDQSNVIPVIAGIAGVVIALLIIMVILLVIFIRKKSGGKENSSPQTRDDA